MTVSSLLLNVYMKPQGEIIDQFGVMYHPVARFELPWKS